MSDDRTIRAQAIYETRRAASNGEDDLWPAWADLDQVTRDAFLLQADREAAQ